MSFVLRRRPRIAQPQDLVAQNLHHPYANRASILWSASGPMLNLADGTEVTVTGTMGLDDDVTGMVRAGSGTGCYLSCNSAVADSGRGLSWLTCGVFRGTGSTSDRYFLEAPSALKWFIRDAGNTIVQGAWLGLAGIGSTQGDGLPVVMIGGKGAGGSSYFGAINGVPAVGYGSGGGNDTPSAGVWRFGAATPSSSYVAGFRPSMFAVFPDVPADELASVIGVDPWQLFAPRRIWVPVSTGGGNLTLTGETSDLSLSGQSSFASTVLTGSNTDISLSGQSSTSLLTLSGTNGTLTLTPQDSNFSLGGNLTLTGEVSDLLLTGQTSTVLVSLVSSNTDLSLTSQTATSNLTVNTTNASLSLIGEDSNFVLVGDLILTGEVADLYLNGLDSQFVLSGAVKGGVSRNKQKKKKRRIQQQQDTSDLDSLVQELESEKQQLKEIKEEIKEELEEIAEEVKEEVQTLEKTEEKLDRLDILSMRIDAVNLAIGNINTQLAKVMTLVENSTSKVTKQIQNLEEVLIVLHEVANDDDD
jgi:hypothetical protein